MLFDDEKQERDRYFRWYAVGVVIWLIGVYLIVDYIASGLKL